MGTSSGRFSQRPRGMKSRDMEIVSQRGLDFNAEIEDCAVESRD